MCPCKAGPVLMDLVKVDGGVSEWIVVSADGLTLKVICLFF